MLFDSNVVGIEGIPVGNRSNDGIYFKYIQNLVSGNSPTLVFNPEQPTLNHIPYGTSEGVNRYLILPMLHHDSGLPNMIDTCIPGNFQQHCRDCPPF